MSREQMSGFLDCPAAMFAMPLLEAEERGASLLGVQIGPYRVLREVARGGMGTVYLAERADDQFEQQVALKLIKRGMDSDEVHRRFRAERQILARLNHPHIARLLDGGVTAEGQPWFAMEYVTGLPITRHCGERNLGRDRRLALFESVCDAVRYAHQSLVVHRDLKPSNVLVTDRGEVKLLDFGIAKVLHATPGDEPLTETNLRAMTPEYAAPEQVRGLPVTTGTDVYALGALLYELLTGRRVHRFERHTPAEIERVICERDPEPPGQGGDLDTILLKALQKDPSRRYASAEALLEDLRRHRAGLPVRARADTLGYRARKFVRRHQVGVVAAAALVLTLIGGLASTIWQARAASREAAKAREVRDFVVGLFNVSRPTEARGREISARELLEQGRRRMDTALADQPEVQAELLDVLGTIYRDLAWLPQADTMLRRSVALSRAVYGAGDPIVAGRLTDLGTVLVAQGRTDDAQPVLEEALRIRRRALGPRHPEVAVTLSSLALALKGGGDQVRAEALYREAISISRTHYGDESLQLAEDLNNLGILRWQLNDLAGADTLYRASLAIRRKLLDPDHPSIVISLHNLAMLRSSQGRHDEAEPIQREILAQRRRLHPSGRHTDVAYALEGLALTLEPQSRFDEAESLHVEAVGLRKELLGASHPETIGAINNLAVVRYRLRDLQGAEAAMREALAGFERTLGPGHQSTRMALNNLGAILSDAGRYTEAEPIIRRALARNRQHSEGSNPAIAMSLRNLGVLLHRTGHLVESQQRFGEAVTIYRATLPDSHPRIAEALTGLGAVLTDGGRPAEAEPLLREALAIRSGKLGPANVRTAESQRELGTCLARLGKVDEAEQLLLESYGVFSGERHAGDEAAETGRRLAAFYAARGDHGRARKFGQASGHR